VTRRRDRIVVAALALALAWTPGCLVVGGSGSLGGRMPSNIEQAIVPGRTTKAEVLSLLGPPNEFKRPELTSALVDDDLRVSGVLATARRVHNVFTWQYDRFSGLGTMLGVVNVIDAETTRDLLIVFFDGNDVVVDVALRQEQP
jgi:hypothetical protein